MRIGNGLLILIAMAALAGCVTAPPLPTAAQNDVADHGEMPQHYKEAISAYFDGTLKDPASVQYRNMTVPKKEFIRDSMLQGYKLNWGWLVSVDVNAKNSYGGYVGFQTYHFLFRGEIIVDMIAPTSE